MSNVKFVWKGCTKPVTELNNK